jgi:hypothetical protein
MAEFFNVLESDLKKYPRHWPVVGGPFSTELEARRDPICRRLDASRRKDEFYGEDRGKITLTNEQATASWAGRVYRLTPKET